MRINAHMIQPTLSRNFIGVQKSPQMAATSQLNPSESIKANSQDRLTPQPILTSLASFLSMVKNKYKVR